MDQPAFYLILSIRRRHEEPTLRESYEIGVELQNMGVVKVFDWDKMTQHDKNWWKKNWRISYLPTCIDTRGRASYTGRNCPEKLRSIYRAVSQQAENMQRAPSHQPNNLPIDQYRGPPNQSSSSAQRHISPRGKHGERVPYTEERNGKLGRLYRQPVSLGAESQRVRFTSHGIRLQ